MVPVCLGDLVAQLSCVGWKSTPVLWKTDFCVLLTRIKVRWHSCPVWAWGLVAQVRSAGYRLLVSTFPDSNSGSAAILCGHGDWLHECMLRETYIHVPVPRFKVR